MKIHSLNPQMKSEVVRTNENTIGEQNQSFKNSLLKAIEKINEAEKTADQKILSLANDGETDLHDVVIAAEKASIQIETAVQIQKKAIDTYNEIMRMQI